MAYTSTAINNIALILIIVSAIKILVLLVNPKSWMNFAKKVYKNSMLTKLVALILAGIVLYYLQLELTIIQILAAGTFMALFLIVGLASDLSWFLKKYEGSVKSGKLWKDYWLYTLIWIVLLGWAVKELFM